MSPGYLDILRKRRGAETVECGKGEVNNKEVFKHLDPSVAYVAYVASCPNEKTIEAPSGKRTIVPLSYNEVPIAPPTECDKSDISDKRVEVLDYSISSLERMCPDYVGLERWQLAVGRRQPYLGEDN